VGARFSTILQTSPGAHPASYIMGTGSFPEVNRPGHSVDHAPTSRAEAKERVELYLYFPYGPSWPVIGWTVPVPLSLTSICLFVCLFVCLFIYLFIYSFIYSFIHLFIYLFIYSFMHLFIYLFIHSFIYLFIYLFIHLFIYSSIYLFVCLFIYTRPHGLIMV
jgi:hypothetical protein